ncbi:SDR family oxidoreductase [Devosia submarina]|uniref:SDR family oxidoreductase n=1 Tax=Devosia submarina TaxID=1173082 RepID=UPI000D391408|nr:SDR family oxidoreductase [Devosia submarina]
MDFGLDGKVLVVTGGTQGVGQAIALRAARSGVSEIVVGGRNVSRGEQTVGMLEELGVSALFVPGDLADSATPQAIFESALAKFGQVDCLVNAAALTDRGSVVDANAEFFDRMFAANTRAPMLLMQQLIQHLKARKAPGSIVNILSINAHGGTPELGVYSASKAATLVLTKNAAFAHRFDRIRINGINLGWTDTPVERVMQAETLGKGPGWLDEANKRMPWGRLVEPDDVARLALFLLGDASIPMTGALIDQDQNFVLGTVG